MLPNGTLTGALKNLQERKSDIALVGFFIKDYETRDVEFTTGVYSDELCIIVKKAKQIPQSLLPLVIFDETLWICLFFATISIFAFWCFLRFFHNRQSFSSNLERKKYQEVEFNLPTDLARKSEKFQYIQLFTDSWILMLSSPMRRFTRIQSERIFIGAVSCLSLIFVSMYQSGLATVFTKPMFYKNIENLDQLDQSGLTIIIKYPAMMADLFPEDSSATFKDLHDKMKLLSADLSAIDVLDVSKVATVTRKTTLKLADDNKDTFLIPECPRAYNLAYVVPKHSVYLSRIDALLLDAQCFGLLAKWIQDINFNVTLGNSLKFQAIESNFKVLTINDLQLPFYILVIGILISTIVLLFERLLARQLNARGII